MEPNTQPDNMPINNTPTSVNPLSGVQQIPVHENKSSIGSIIGTIIIIAIIILGGLYFWGKRVDEAKIKQDLVSEEQTNDTLIDSTSQVLEDENMEANAIRSVGNSDELDSIENDLKNTNLNNLGAELEQ